MRVKKVSLVVSGPITISETPSYGLYSNHQFHVDKIKATRSNHGQKSIL